MKYKDDYIKMEEELKQLTRSAKQIDNGVDHLWKIKETEYQNVYAILQLMNQKK